MLKSIAIWPPCQPISKCLICVNRAPSFRKQFQNTLQGMLKAKIGSVPFGFSQLKPSFFVSYHHICVRKRHHVHVSYHHLHVVFRSKCWLLWRNIHLTNFIQTTFMLFYTLPYKTDILVKVIDIIISSMGSRSECPNIRKQRIQINSLNIFSN